MVPACLPAYAPVTARAPARPATVLVAEDDFLLAELAAEVLTDEGYRVLVAADAERAELLIAAGGVDLLFTDIDLAKGTNGLDLARRARRRLPLLPVIYASGGRWRLDPAEAVAGSTFLPKPYRIDDVLAVIAGALGR